MTQITRGLRAVLANGRIYQAFQDLLGKHNRRQVVETYIRPKPGQCLLDVGCGPGAVLSDLPADIDYIGVDLSEDYIRRARSTYGDRGTFICASLAELDFKALGRQPDIVLAKGLLHHLEDREVIDLFQNIARILPDHGRLVTLDPCKVPQAHPIARFVIAQDRGQNVRTPEAYQRLAAQVFPQVQVFLRDDLLRIPYNHIIMECTPATKS